MPMVTRKREDGTTITVDAAQLMSIYYLEMLEGNSSHISQAQGLMRSLGYVDEDGLPLPAILIGEEK